MLKQLPTPSKKRYLKPSVFWSIRQGFPYWLSVLLSVGAIALLLLVWALLSYPGLVSPKFLPTPTTVLRAGISLFAEDDLLFDIWISSARVGAGFLAAAALSIPIGIAMGTFHSMESFLMPLIGPIRYVPIAAFIPLILLCVGLDETAKILIIFLGIFFYNAIMIADAVKFIPSEMLNVAYTLGATRRTVLFRVILPAAFPSILDSLRVNIAGAWNFLVISELIAAERGLGYRIFQFQRSLQTDKVLFCIALIGVIGLFIDYAFKAIAKIVTPWVEQ